MSLVSMFVFPAPTPSYTMHSFPSELLWIPLSLADKRTAGGSVTNVDNKASDSVPAVILRSPAARFFIIYLHSNGEDIGLAYPFGCGLRMVLEVHVLLVEYPGYGICPGQCSEEALWRVAQAAYLFVTETLKWPEEDVIIMGRSLGAAVAMRLACTYAPHGLILVAPFLSLVEAVSQYVGNALAPMFVGNAFSNRDFIGRVDLPTLVIHGMNDRLVACSQGKRLWELCPHQKKLFVSPEQMSHNSDLLSNADFLIRPMLRFFALPDYSFVDFDIPSESFDKRHCPQYHRLIETMKTEKPLARPGGDEEPCPESGTMDGPKSVKSSLSAIGGDDDDLEGSNEHNVQSPPSGSKSPKLSWSPQSAAVNEDMEHLNRLTAQLGLQRPSNIPFPSLAAVFNEQEGVASPEQEMPMAEVTEEMLGDLNNFLHGREHDATPRSEPAPAGQSQLGLFTPYAALEHTGGIEAAALPAGMATDTGLRPRSSPSESFSAQSSFIHSSPMKEIGDGQECSAHKEHGPKYTLPVACRPRVPDVHGYPATASADASSVDASRLWEEGSTAEPSTQETSVSRWSEDSKECRAPEAAAPGACILNLDNGITRFLHEVPSHDDVGDGVCRDL